MPGKPTDAEADDNETLVAREHENWGTWYATQTKIYLNQKAQRQYPQNASQFGPLLAYLQSGAD